MNITPGVPLPSPRRKWFDPLIYAVLVFIAFLPLITERPYNPRQDTPYALFNLNHWAVPDRVWLGVMHLPLLALSLTALGLAHFASDERQAGRSAFADPAAE